MASRTSIFWRAFPFSFSYSLPSCVSRSESTLDNGHGHAIRSFEQAGEVPANLSIGHPTHDTAAKEANAPISTRVRGILFASVTGCAAMLYTLSPEISQRSQHFHDRSVVAESLAHMSEHIPVTWSKDKAGTQLKGILAQFVLTVAGGRGLLAGGEIVPPEEVKKVGLLEVRDLVSTTLFIDQQGEGDPCLVAKEPSVVEVPKTDCGEAGTGVPNFRAVIAQLRDLLAAEDSSIVAQKNEHRGSFVPQGPEANCLAVCVYEFNGGKGGTQSVGDHP